MNLEKPSAAMAATLEKVASVIEKGVASKEVRLMVRAMRLTVAVRRKLKSSALVSFLKQILPPSSEPLARLLPYVSKVGTDTLH